MMRCYGYLLATNKAAVASKIYCYSGFTVVLTMTWQRTSKHEAQKMAEAQNNETNAAWVIDL